MRGTNPGLAALLVGAVVACTSNQAAATRSPSPVPSGVASPSFASSPSPVQAQRQELSLPVPVEETAAATAGGKLYVMGGFNAAGASLASVYVFDGHSWTSGPQLPLPLDHASAATLDDRVYIAGGHSNGADSTRVFRLDGDHWSELARLTFARGGHALVASGGLLVAIGGNTVRGNVPPVESYDPQANAWTVLPNLPSPRNHVSGFVQGQFACVAGGRSPTTARVDCVAAAAPTWSSLPDLPRVTSGAGAVTFPSGDIVVAGGQNAGETAIVDQLTRYVPGSGWTAGETMLAPRHGFELAIFEGRAWACGGGSAPGLHPVATCTSIGDPGAPVRGK